MTALSALAMGRAAAERLMVDTCTVEHRTGETVDADGRSVATYATVYAGKCRVQSRGFSSQYSLTGQQRVDLRTVELHLPVTATGVQAHDRVTITASHDPDLATRVFRVNNPDPKTFATKQKAYLEEIVA